MTFDRKPRTVLHADAEDEGDKTNENSVSNQLLTQIIGIMATKQGNSP